MPAFGYGIRVMAGYSESVLLISEKMPTPVLSNCQYAIERPSLYDRNPTRFWQCIAALLFIALMIALAHLR